MMASLKTPSIILITILAIFAAKSAAVRAARTNPLPSSLLPYHAGSPATSSDPPADVSDKLTTKDRALYFYFVTSSVFMSFGAYMYLWVTDFKDFPVWKRVICRMLMVICYATWLSGLYLNHKGII